MQRTSKRNKQLRITCKELPPDKKKKEHIQDFVAIIPPEISYKIFSELDIRSLCMAAVTCRSWNEIIDNSDHLWKNHCLTVRAVCQREIDCDRGSGYSWKVTLIRNYRKCTVKNAWLSGKYSNIQSFSVLQEKSMCPMDAETWGEILEAELER
ncbi:F-box only protein 48 [Ambystoma mexicanum]|uniref:F-box only protein 48 n=1 Tax=Ambystoma mexicanum TaxID=8296 RepID=UPI0037E83757